MGLDFLVPIFGILIVLVPITGLTVVFTTKYASRAIFEAMERVRGEGGSLGGASDLRLQVRDLGEQVEDLTREIRLLKDAQTFDQRLLKEAGSSPATED